MVATGPVAAGTTRCSKKRNPVQEIEYGTSEMKGTFTFDMKRCFPDDHLATMVRADLLRVSSDGRGTGTGWAISCERGEECRLTVTMEHELVERAEYKFRLFYEAPNGRNRRLDIEWMTCTSAAAVASCDL